MRRIATWLLVGAVAALGVAAGVDALGGGEEPERSEAEPQPRARTTTEAEESGLAEAAVDLREAGVQGGVLTYADEDCAVHSLTLPDLEPHPAPTEHACRFTVSLGDVVSFGRAHPDPGLFYTAECRNGRVDVLTADGHPLARYRGCAPAWRADGALSLIRAGAIIELSGPSEPRIVRERVVLSRADVAREVRRAGWTGYRFTVEEIAWLSGKRLAAIVQARRRRETVELLGVFSGSRLVSEPGYGYDGLTGLRPSPTGAFVAARIASPGGLAVVDRDGETARPAIRHGDALTWSPDERWIAEATADVIYVFRADEPSPQFVHIPIVARDLFWR